MKLSGILILCVSTALLLPVKADEIQLPPCDYPAVFNFGDSNSDTGGIAAAFYPAAPPSGETFFHRPVGRASDGRLDSLGSSYRHGANFATGGSTIMRPNESWFENGVSPFSLEIQVEQYTQFKDRTVYHVNEVKKKSIKMRLPKQKEFVKALFTLDIGQNDIAAGIRKLSLEQQKADIPNIISYYSTQLRSLYEKGARTFWIHNTGPIGCSPVATVKVQDPMPGYLDEHGFLLRNCIFLFAGFGDPFQICCGYHGIGYDIWCGNTGSVNGSQVSADSCRDPSVVISWDGLHYSEAANHWIANRIINGSLSDPPMAITRACHRKL